jgi:AcrR family transcriptional regulator
MTNEITEASILVLASAGMDDWSIAAVAREAGCAKGLIHYYFRSRADLLAAMARAILSARHTRRIVALSSEGTAAIDALWGAITSEVTDGTFAALLGLSAVKDPAVREALRRTESDQTELGQAAARALAIEIKAAELGAIVDAGLTGFQMALLRDVPAARLEEAHHRFWLALLG